MESTTVPKNADDVTERDHKAAAVVLPEFEERLKTAHARNLSAQHIAGIQEEYNAARYEEVDAADSDDGLDDLNKNDLVDLADEHDVDLTGARTNADRVDRLRAAGVTAD